MSAFDPKRTLDRIASEVGCVLFLTLGRENNRLIGGHSSGESSLRLNKGATMHRIILTASSLLILATASSLGGDLPTRSEERRVGKEGRLAVPERYASYRK